MNDTNNPTEKGTALDIVFRMLQALAHGDEEQIDLTQIKDALLEKVAQVATQIAETDRQTFVEKAMQIVCTLCDVHPIFKLAYPFVVPSAKLHQLTQEQEGLQTRLAAVEQELVELADQIDTPQPKSEDSLPEGWSQQAEPRFDEEDSSEDLPSDVPVPLPDGWTEPTDKAALTPTELIIQKARARMQEIYAETNRTYTEP